MSELGSITETIADVAKVAHTTSDHAASTQQSVVQLKDLSARVREIVETFTY